MCLLPTYPSIQPDGEEVEPGLFSIYYLLCGSHALFQIIFTIFFFSASFLGQVDFLSLIRRSKVTENTEISEQKYQREIVKCQAGTLEWILYAV